MNDAVSGAEIPLAGGNLSTVVRVGETVRRPAGSWTPAVHELLDYLAEKGFIAAPRAIGVISHEHEPTGRPVFSLA